MRWTLCLLFAAALTASAQKPGRVESQVFVTAIDVVADVRDASGRLPRGLTPADFVLLEDGVERTVIAVDYLRAEPLQTAQQTDQSSVERPTVARPRPPAEWQVVIYFETLLSNGISRKRAAEALIRNVEPLVRMGAVDVIFAAPLPTALVRNSRDPLAVQQALRRIVDHPGMNQLTAHRREFFREAQSLAGLHALKSANQRPVVIEVGKPPQAQPDFDASSGSAPATYEAAVVRPYIEAEIQLISRFRTGLLTWLSSYRRHVPRALLMVTDGFDVNPLDFYTGHLTKADQITMRSHITQTALSESTDRMAYTLAAGGWSTISIPGDHSSEGWVDDSSHSGMGRAHDLSRRSTPRAFLSSPLEPLNGIADATGGKVVSNSGKIAEVIDGLDERVKLTYQVNRRPDGTPRKIVVRSRDRNLDVRAIRWASSSTPDEIAETRALGLLGAYSYAGDLPVESSVQWESGNGRRRGTLRATTKLDLVSKFLPAAARGEFRFTLAVQVPPNRAFVVNRVISNYDLSPGLFQVRSPIDLPRGASLMVVVVEETATGLWGSARVELH